MPATSDVNPEASSERISPIVELEEADFFEFNVSESNTDRDEELSLCPAADSPSAFFDEEALATSSGSGNKVPEYTSAT